MNPVYAAALALQEFVSTQSWKFCTIGGLAVQRWGVERSTRDADMTVLTRFEDGPVVDALLSRFSARIPQAREFALRSRVLLLVAENGVPLDIALGGLDFEERCIARSSWWQASQDVRLFTCSAEDLIVHKAFAGRDRDWSDVARVIAVQRERLDADQIISELRPLAELKEDSDIVPRLEAMLRKQGLRP